MPFDLSVLLTLKFRGRSVVVPRDRCSDYDGIIALAQRNLRLLRSFAHEDLVLVALIPNYPDKKEVEVSKDAWPLVSAVVQYVTISLESELRSSADPDKNRIPTPPPMLPPPNLRPGEPPSRAIEPWRREK